MDREKLEIIALIDKKFGESNWSLSISSTTLDFVDNDHGRFSAGASAVVRIQRLNGAFREGMGFGTFISVNKSEAIAKARKEAVLIALKGAFRSFGGDITLTTPIESVALGSTTSSHAPAILASNRSSKQSPSSVPNVKIQNRVPPTSSNAPVVPAQPVPSASKPQGVSSRILCSPPVPIAITAPTTATSSPSSVLKINPVNRKLNDDGPSNASAPLAIPLTAAQVLSEEDRAKAERLRRSKLKQEEWKQKRLQEAQAQNITEGKLALPPEQPGQKPEVVRSLSLKQNNQQNCKVEVPKNGSLNLDADDDLIMSTQDLEAVLQSAVNNSVASRRIHSESPSLQNGAKKRIRT